MDDEVVKTVSKLSLEQVHEKRRLEAPEIANKTSSLVHQATISSSQICKEVQKPYCGRGPGCLSLKKQTGVHYQV